MNYDLFCRGDTTLILGTCAGMLTGSWLIVTLDIQDDLRVINPVNNSISWPSLYDIGKYYLKINKTFRYRFILDNINK